MVEATHKNLLPQKFCHIDTLCDRKMAAEFRKKLQYAHVDTTFTTTYGKLLLEKCWFA